MLTRYDREADAAYIQFAPTIGPGGVKWSYNCDPSEIKGMINLDFDANDRLIGVEVMDASKRLPPNVLEDAEKISGSVKLEDLFS